MLHWSPILNSVGRTVEYAALSQDKQALVEKAQASIDRFARFNPYWGKRAYIVLARGRKAICRYSSDQGTSNIDIVR